MTNDIVTITLSTTESTVDVVTPRRGALMLNEDESQRWGAYEAEGREADDGHPLINPAPAKVRAGLR